MSSVEKIVRFISDIDIMTTIPQNIVFLVATLFVVSAPGNYALKLKVNYFLIIMSLFFVILCIFRKYYNIICQFTILNQFFTLLVYCLSHKYTPCLRHNPAGRTAIFYTADNGEKIAIEIFSLKGLVD